MCNVLRTPKNAFPVIRLLLILYLCLGAAYSNIYPNMHGKPLQQFRLWKGKTVAVAAEKKRAAHSAAQCCALFVIKQKMNSNQITKSNEMHFS